MVKAGMLERINQDKILNLENIDKKFLNPTFDPNRDYSIPYMWGTIGIGYDKTVSYTHLTLPTKA